MDSVLWKGEVFHQRWKSQTVHTEIRKPLSHEQGVQRMLAGVLLGLLGMAFLFALLILGVSGLSELTTNPQLGRWIGVGAFLLVLGSCFAMVMTDGTAKGIFGAIFKPILWILNQPAIHSRIAGQRAVKTWSVEYLKTPAELALTQTDDGPVLSWRYRKLHTQVLETEQIEGSPPSQNEAKLQHGVVALETSRISLDWVCSPEDNTQTYIRVRETNAPEELWFCLESTTLPDNVRARLPKLTPPHPILLPVSAQKELLDALLPTLSARSVHLPPDLVRMHQTEPIAAPAFVSA